jgi:hypothetical protein
MNREANSENLDKVSNEIRDWANTGMETLSPPIRQSLLKDFESRPADFTQATPSCGAVFVTRRDGERSFAVSDPVWLASGDRIEVPEGAWTELQFPDRSTLLLRGGSLFTIRDSLQGERGRLDMGRLYAWVARQRLGSFRIGTPMGAVAVVGTEFDLNIKGENDMRLLVTKGEVRFKPETNKFGEEKRLLPGDMLTRSMQTAQVRRLTPKEMRAETGWAVSRRGSVNPMVLVGIVILVLVVGIYFYMQSGKPSSSGSATTASQGTTGATASSTMKSPFHTPGISWKSEIVQNGMMIVGNGPAQEQMTIRIVTTTRILPPQDASEIARSEMEINDISCPQNYQFAAYAPGLIGRKYASRILKDGKSETLGVVNGQKISFEEFALFGISFGGSDFALIYSADHTSPKTGENWEYLDKQTIRDVSDCTLASTGKVTFQGNVQDNGKTLACYEIAANADITGNMTMEIREGPVIAKLAINRIQTDGTTRLMVDTATGYPVRAENTNTHQSVQGNVNVMRDNVQIATQPLNQDVQSNLKTDITFTF